MWKETRCRGGGNCHRINDEIKVSRTPDTARLGPSTAELGMGRMTKPTRSVRRQLDFPLEIQIVADDEVSFAARLFRA